MRLTGWCSQQGAVWRAVINIALDERHISVTGDDADRKKAMILAFALAITELSKGVVTK